jgi:hypothetical protein
MAMSRKNYIKIAKAVLTHKRSMLNTSNYVNSEYVDFVHDLCVIFEEDNDRFCPDKFKQATEVI